VKVCKQCGKEQPLTEFWKRDSKRGHGGHYARCRTCTNASTRVYRSKNKDKWRAINREAWVKLRRDVLAAYGGKCLCCGETRYEFLALDHVGGAGGKHRKLVGTGGTYSEAKRRGFPPCFRIFCHNCNQSRGYYGYCPHEHQVPINASPRRIETETTGFCDANTGAYFCAI
jgi:hypothetical protein